MYKVEPLRFRYIRRQERGGLAKEVLVRLNWCRAKGYDYRRLKRVLGMEECKGHAYQYVHKKTYLAIDQALR